MDLHLNADDLAQCVSCGLCLPHCPTYRVTTEEASSPRGRIAAMRAVQTEPGIADASFFSSIDSCVQCRGCETACPSGVKFGSLMEGTRSTLAASRQITPRWQRLGYRTLQHHRLLLVGSRLLAVAQRARLVPSRFGVPPLPLKNPPLVATGHDVWFFPGCVMDAWQRPVHAAAIRVLQAMGVGAALPSGSGAACCGALHVHAGLTSEAKGLAERVMASFPGVVPILVDSAGCGAAMKDYGHLLGTAEARAFSDRVQDIHTFLAEHADQFPSVVEPQGKIIVQDPCHLRHVQRKHLDVRRALAPFAEVVELDDEGLCCGAGGAYSSLHPAIAGDIRERKLASIARATVASGATLVASANPGCAMHLAAAGARVVHPVEIIDAALGVPVAGEFDQIRSRLEAIAEELADLAIARLRESIDAGGKELPVDEKRLTRARRAVEKAIGILQEPDDH
jgi:glycolate oxidase iron-sulfur subunit